LPTRREVYDRAGKPQRAEKIRWNKLFLKSSDKAESLESLLEHHGLDTMLRQYIASNILNR
jgi:hypothetical protein